MIIDKKKVGETIHEIRQRNGYSMEQFGKQIGDAPRGSVNSWEKGVNLPNKERLELIAIMGNTTTDELLYGSLNDYVSNLIYANLGVKISYHFIDPFVSYLINEGFTYGDDVEILRFAKGFFNSQQVVTNRPSVFYSAIFEEDSLYIAYLNVNQKSIPYYWAFSDKEKDTLHVTSFLLGDNYIDNYNYPSSITNSGEHDYFTSGFMSLKLRLLGFTMFYYGIDSINLTPQISKFNYDVESDALVLDTGKMQVSELYTPFVKSIEKESLYLKHSLLDNKNNDTAN